MDTRVCKECGSDLPIEFFEVSKRRRDGLRQTCELCREKRRLRYVARYPNGKPCNPCGRTLPLESFCRLDSGSYHAWCRPCASEKSRAKYEQPETRAAALADRAAYRKANRDWILKRDRKTMRLRRLAVLTYYGNGIAACVCCGVSEHEFLTLDHIDANGADHRKELRKSGVGGYATGWFIYKWLIDNDYPDGYQTLCFNCNVGKHRTKINKCPHEIARQIIGTAHPNQVAQQPLELSRAA